MKINIEWLIFTLAILGCFAFSLYVGIDEGRKRQWAEDKPLLQRSESLMVKSINSEVEAVNKLTDCINVCNELISQAKEGPCQL